MTILETARKIRKEGAGRQITRHHLTATLVCLLMGAGGSLNSVCVDRARGEPPDHGMHVLLPADTTTPRSDAEPATPLRPAPTTYTVYEAYPDGYAPRDRGNRGEPVLIYQNTLGEILFAPGRGRWVADDLWTRLTAPCALDKIRVRVTGGVEGGGGEFRAQIALYDDCPDPIVGGQEILGTSLTYSSLNDDLALFHDLVVDFSDRGICNDETTCSISLQDCIDDSPCTADPVEIPTVVWLRVRFTTDEAAIVAGAPAQRGFSADGYHDLFGNCSTWFGGWPTGPHASFWIEIHADAGCQTGFLAYLAASPAAPPLFPTSLPGGLATSRLADDITLAVPTCTLSAFQLGMKGNTGEFELSVDMRWPELTSLVPETARIFHGRGEGSVEIAHFSIPPDISVTIEEHDQPIYITWSSDHSLIGVLNVGEAQVGTSGPEFYAFDTALPGAWSSFVDPAGSAVVYAAVWCRGDSPVGACCMQIPTPQGPEEFCRDAVPPVFCQGGRWLADTTCEENLFDPPCRSAACCMPDFSCENLSETDCGAAGGVSNAPLLCDTLPVGCLQVSCVGASGDCRIPRLTPACGDESCCRSVCLYDPWCCENDWDEQCVEEAYLMCSLEPLNHTCDDAFEIAPSGRTFFDNRAGAGDEDHPGFSCHTGGVGAHSTAPRWFKFTASHTSARLSTCVSLDAAGDSLLEVYAVDALDPCHTLVSVGCSDDAEGCGWTGNNSDVCVEDLVLGATYYVLLAVKSQSERGLYRLEIQSPCPGAAPANDGEYQSLQGDSSSGGTQVSATAASSPTSTPAAATVGIPNKPKGQHLEVPDDPPATVIRSQASSPAFCLAGSWDRGVYTMVQVNVNDVGENSVGDAANEPSLAISPVDPNKIVIGFRQFDVVTSNFRQAGMAYSHDAGQSWTFPGVLDPGVFRSDPVLGADTNGNFFYYSLTEDFSCDMFASNTGGVFWTAPKPAKGGDKAWLAIDPTPGVGRNHIYAVWSSSFSCCTGSFTRSTTAGATYDEPIWVPRDPFWGTLTVNLDGAVFVAGTPSIAAPSPVIRSQYMQDPDIAPTFDLIGEFDLGGSGGGWVGPNPEGLLGQTWIASDHSHSAQRGNLYILASVGPPTADPADVMFTRSEDGGFSWSSPVRVNDDPVGNGAWQWFGTMSVAPNGRIDAVWNDTRDTGVVNLSQVFYSYSIDGGRTWSENVSLTPVFDSWVGWPNQNKLGDYYHMISDNAAANLAFAATFNNEQDVFFMRIEPEVDCNDNAIPDRSEIASGAATDCNNNLVPDTCEPDTDGDGLVNGCDPDIDGDGVDNETDVCDETPLNVAVKPDGGRLGDFQSDCDIDLRDYRSFVICLLDSGPGVPGTPIDCPESFDFNHDGDIDLEDLSRLQITYTGLIRVGPT